MLRDALTVFFLVGGSLLLWLNFRRQPSHVILTKSGDDGHRSIAGPSLDELAREVAAEKAADVGSLEGDLIADQSLCPMTESRGCPAGPPPEVLDQK
jgi:hypothetical protein